MKEQTKSDVNGYAVHKEPSCPENTSTAVDREKRDLLDKQAVQNEKRGYLLFCRIRDIVVSIAVLLLLLIPMGLLALIIYIDSPGASPIYKQKRVGLNGREFMLYKFRSMVPDADKKLKELLSQNEMDGPVFKIRKDPRITRVGRFIRKTSIDELPQLYNILLGDMSLIGPRPPLPREVSKYGDYEMQRLYVVPGLTCYWQIQPNRNAISFEKWVELDLRYIRERGIKTDVLILIGTVKAVLHAEGQ